MTRKKNSFFTFIFSLLPGAGEMYLGFFKQGISIMTCFFLGITIISWLELGPLMCVLPVLWFYSFFHVHNIASLPDEDFYALEDKYIFDYDPKHLKEMFGKESGRKILAITLIVIGCMAIWNFIVNILSQLLGRFYVIYRFLHSVPQLVLAVAIIYLGISLIKGKKHDLDQGDIVKEDLEKESSVSKEFKMASLEMKDNVQEILKENTDEN